MPDGLRTAVSPLEGVRIDHTSFTSEEKQQSASHLAKSDTLAVEIIATEASMYGFIDDIITITVDGDHWIDRAKTAALLVIHTLF